MKKFKKVRTKKTHHFGSWYKVDIDEVVLPSGKIGEYNVVRLPKFPIIIPIDNNGNIYLVKQHRYTINQISIELPKGHADDQDLIDAAKRELLEETGFVANNWVELGVIYDGNGIGELPGTIFVAKDLKKKDTPKEMDNESISEVLKCSIKQVRQMITAGEITDTSTISSFAKADYSGIFN